MFDFEKRKSKSKAGQTPNQNLILYTLGGEKSAIMTTGFKFCTF